MFERIWIVFAKEVIDNLRDRRSVSMAFVYPLIGPVMVGIMILLVNQAVAELPSSGFTLPVEGAERAPRLISYIAERGGDIVAAPADVEGAVRSGEYDAILVIAEDFGARFAGEKPARVQIYSEGSRLSAVVAMTRILTLVGDYNRQVTGERLRAYGVEPAVAEPIAAETVSVGAGQSLTGFFLNMMPPFIMFTIFIGGIYLAIDTTSGERERGSLEPLLINPIPRWELMAGKTAAAFSFTAAALALQLAAFGAMFALIAAGAMAPGVGPDGLTFLTIFAISLPLMLFAVGLQVIVATLTQSFKETQTYLGLLPLIPSLPGLVLIFVAFQAHPWMMTIPTFGQTVLFGQLVRGEAVSLINVAVASAVTLGFSAVLLCLAARFYQRERLLFGAV